MATGLQRACCTTASTLRQMQNWWYRHDRQCVAMTSGFGATSVILTSCQTDSLGQSFHSKENQDFQGANQNSPSGGGVGGGWGPGTQKSKGLCTKNSQINIWFCKISFFPTMKSGSGGGGSPPPPTKETLSC